MSREQLWAAEKARAVESARASIAPPPAPAPQPGDNQHPSESPEAFLARVAREMTDQ